MLAGSLRFARGRGQADTVEFAGGIVQIRTLNPDWRIGVMVQEYARFVVSEVLKDGSSYEQLAQVLSSTEDPGMPNFFGIVPTSEPGAEEASAQLKDASVIEALAYVTDHALSEERNLLKHQLHLKRVKQQ